jgi:hypothetical protein
MFPSSEQPADPHAVEGPQREQNRPEDGKSGRSMHAGRAPGPLPRKLQAHCTAQTLPIIRPKRPYDVPPSPNHDTPDRMPLYRLYPMPEHCPRTSGVARLLGDTYVLRVSSAYATRFREWRGLKMSPGM